MKQLERKETAKWEREECITALQEGGGNKEKDGNMVEEKGDRKSLRSGVKVVIVRWEERHSEKWGRAD